MHGFMEVWDLSTCLNDVQHTAVMSTTHINLEVDDIFLQSPHTVQFDGDLACRSSATRTSSLAASLRARTREQPQQVSRSLGPRASARRTPLAARAIGAHFEIGCRPRQFNPANRSFQTPQHHGQAAVLHLRGRQVLVQPLLLYVRRRYVFKAVLLPASRESFGLPTARTNARALAWEQERCPCRPTSLERGRFWAASPPS
jgi:hypothetical protein